MKLFKVALKDVKLEWKRKFPRRWQIFENEFDQFQKLLRNWRKNRIKNWQNRRKIWRVSSAPFQRKNQAQNIRVHVIHQLTIFLIWTNSKMKLIKSKKRIKLYAKCRLYICKYPSLIIFILDDWKYYLFRKYNSIPRIFKISVFNKILPFLRQNTKTITRVISRIFTNSAYIWLLRFSWNDHSDYDYFSEFFFSKHN